MKIGIITDVHSNIFALKAVLEALKDMDTIYSLGDAIAIGPYPKESLDLMIKRKIIMLKGNHEQYYLMDDAALDKHIISEGEINHQKWVAVQLGQAYKKVIEDQPMFLELKVNDVNIHLSHYAIEGQTFKDILKEPDGSSLYKYFNGRANILYIFGHHHPIHDFEYGGSRFINPGSLGCSHDNLARYLVLEVDETGYKVYYKAVSYDKSALIKAMDDLKVPERTFIKPIFLGVKDDYMD